MQRDDVVRWRMHRQHLWGGPLETPENAVRWLVAMQAQEFGPAKWSVAQRATGVSNVMMDQALASGRILRTHVLRPTWHFVVPADLRWLLTLTAPRVNVLNAYQYRALELDDALFARSHVLLAGAVEGGRHCTRAELAVVLRDGGIIASGLRLGYFLMRAELDAVLCSGAPRGKQQTYTSFDERVPPSGAVDPEAALAELTERYFASRGPATLKDYLRWSSLTVTDGKRGLDMVRSRLECEVIEGRTYWFATSSWRAPPSSGPSTQLPVVDLVQGYDECIMSYSESKDLIHRPEATAPVLSGTAVFTHAVLIDGRVIGHWRPVLTRRTVTIETQLYRPLSGVERLALDAAGERYGQFVELPVSVP